MSSQPNSKSESDSLPIIPLPIVLRLAVAFALLAMVLGIAAKNMVVDLDLFHEMSLYRQMESENKMPRTDAFAYTPTVEPVVHHEWATGAVMYWASVTSGLGGMGIVLVKYFLTFGICIGCFLIAVRRGASQASFAILAPLALLVGGGMAFTNVRAQLFTLFFFVILFFLIELDRMGKRWWIAAWCLMFVAWGNIHGGVLSGLGMLGVYGFVRMVEAYLETRSLSKTFFRVAHLLGVGVVSFLLLYVNPYGSDYVPYLFRAVTMPRPNIVEWWPLYQVKSPLFFLVSAAIAVYAISYRGKENLFESLALVLTAYLAWKHYRHGSLYAVTWACFVPPMISRTGLGESFGGLWKKHPTKVAVVAFAIGVIALGFSFNAKFWKLRVPNQREVASKRITTFPVGACAYLRDQNFKGNLFVPFVAGAYVSWELYPEVKVSIDSRYEVAYPIGALEEETAFCTAADNWEAILNKYDTQAVLIPVELPIARVLESRLATEEPSKGGVQPVSSAGSFGWKLVYQDNTYALYVNASLADSLPILDRRNEFIEGVIVGQIVPDNSKH